MECRNYSRVGETLYHEVLDNGLHIYVDPKPEFGKYFAFFATNYGGMDVRFQLNGQWHSPTSHYNPSFFLSYGMLSAWSFGLRSNQSNIGSVIFHFLGPFDPIWGFFVSSEKFGSYWIHLSCRVLFYFFLLEIKSEL